MIATILADIHANLYALDRVLEETNGNCDEYWFLGDLTGYGPHAAQCVARMRALEAQGRLRWVAGNHDLALRIGEDTEVGLGNLSYAARCTGSINREQLEEEPRLMRWYLERVRPQHAEPQEVRLGSDLYLIVHASLTDHFQRYVFIEPQETMTLRGQFESLRSRALKNGVGPNARVCLLYGHTHRPGFAWLEQDSRGGGNIYFDCNKLFCSGYRIPLVPGRLFLINAGSVGQPRDGNPEACYAQLDTENHTAELKRVAYPIEKTIEDMRKSRFPTALREFLGDWLRLGQDPGYRPQEKLDNLFSPYPNQGAGS